MGAVGVTYLVIIIVAVLIYIFIKLCCIVVEQGTAVVVERFGRFYRKYEGGIHLLMPLVDRPRRVIWRTYDIDSSSRSRYKETYSPRIDLRQTIYDLPIQDIITRDNVKISVHPMMRMNVTDPVRVAYETYDLFEAVEKLVQTSLRSVIGDMGLDDTLASRQEIERAVSNKVYKICRDWGLNISSVDLLEIDPTPTIQKAMHEQIKAERYRRTKKVQAEGYAERIRLEAEGECQAAKAKATGEAECIKLQAKGSSDARLIIAQKTADSIRLIADAVKKVTNDPTQYMIGLQYVNAIKKITSKANVDVYLPLETDISGAATFGI